jgi:protein-tyrosine-phosphatase
MRIALNRKAESLRRILFLCANNYHASRFCEELFNSFARTEGLYWQATSRAMWPRPAERNEGPMSVCAIEALRELGAAPVNHLRLPLPVGEFDVRTSATIVVIGEQGPLCMERLAGAQPPGLEYWPHDDAGRASRDGLLSLAQALHGLVASVRDRPAFELDYGIAGHPREHSVAC